VTPNAAAPAASKDYRISTIQHSLQIERKVKGFSTDSAIGEVKMMSAKIDSAFVALNKDSRMLIDDELIGKRFEMDGRPVLDTEIVRTVDGRNVAFFDQTPMQRVLARWKEGDFEAMEHELARVCRARLAAIDLENILRLSKSIRNKEGAYASRRSAGG
jgi:hypothetical protein